jgi:GNAT superfamily N-acetyltransferase
MIIRPARAADLPRVVALRMRMFAEVSEASSVVADAGLEESTARFFSDPGCASQCQTWVAQFDSAVVAAGTLALFTRPPYPGNLAGREGYLFNMYTLPEFRRRGCARAIFESIVKYAKGEGYGKLWLHASDAGRPLYSAAGFAPAATYLEWTPD